MPSAGSRTGASCWDRQSMAELQELAAWAADLVAAQAQEPRGWTQAARSTPQQALVARRSDLVDFGLWTA